MTRCDFLIVGAGMAGASAAYGLSAYGKVIILEAEEQAAYHTTGRSAAFFAPSYGGAAAQPLTVGSTEFFESPPEGFSEVPLLHPRGALHVGTADDSAAIDACYDTYHTLAPGMKRLVREEILELCPVLKPDYVVHGLYDPDCSDMDVDAIHQGFLRGARAAGSELWLDALLTGLSKTSNGWRATTKQGEIEATVVVNAAGAWGDAVAELAGVAPIGLTPMRRTVVTFPCSYDGAFDHWPLAADIGERFYFKPESGRILASLSEETPLPAQDAQPDEMDVAITADRIMNATTLEVRRIESKWAGLRTFAPDRAPVYGFDPDASGFFWCAGQGGFGIQTAPAAAELVGALATDGAVPDKLAAFGVDAAPSSPSRFR